MLPPLKPGAMKKNYEVRPSIRRFGRSIVDYGKNVVGGAKIVGSAINKGIDKAVVKVTDDLFGSPEIDKKQKAAGAALNKEYSGAPDPKLLKYKRRSTSDGSMR